MREYNKTKQPQTRPKTTTQAHARYLQFAVVAALLLVPASGATLLLTSPAHWGAWTLERVSPAENIVNPHTDLALDSNDNPHSVEYYGGPETWYTHRTEAGWQREYIGKGDEPGIAVSSTDEPHIVYDNWSTSGTYAYRSGGVWVQEPIGTGSLRAPRIVLDGDDKPHVAWVSWDGKNVKYAYKDTSGWHVELVETLASGFWGYPIGLDLDSSGTPHLAYSSASGAGVLRYASRVGSNAWTVEIIDVNGGKMSGLAIDTIDRPHISYLGTGEHLRYATKVPAGWAITVVDQNAPTGWQTSIDTDSSNRPHITYFYFNRGNTDDVLRNHVKYARLTAAGWITETVDWTGWNGLSSTIRIDQNDFPHVVYKFSFEQKLELGRSHDLYFATPIIRNASNALGHPGLG